MRQIPISVEMSMVKGCEASQCVYNAESACHAKAITIGDTVNPGCDTFLGLSSPHTRSVKRQAGVGACKMTDCNFNEEYECAASEITVGVTQDSAQCMSYMQRS